MKDKWKEPFASISTPAGRLDTVSALFFHPSWKMEILPLKVYCGLVALWKCPSRRSPGLLSEIDPHVFEKDRRKLLVRLLQDITGIIASQGKFEQ